MRERSIPMSATETPAAPNSPPAELQNMLAEKRKTLQHAQAPNPLQAIVKSLVGAGMGFIAGTGAVLGGAAGLTMGTLRKVKESDWMKKNSGKAVTPETQKELERFVEKDVLHEIQHGGSLSAHLVRNARTWTLGMTAAGAAAGYSAYASRHQKAAEHAEKDVRLLERIHGSWQERAQAEDDKSCGCPTIH